MSTKFVLDRELLQQQKVIEEVLSVLKKEPYPDRKTQHLATFVHAMFQVEIGKRKAKEEKKQLFPILKQEPLTVVEIKAEKPLQRILPTPPVPHRKILEIPEPKKLIVQEHLEPPQASMQQQEAMPQLEPLTPAEQLPLPAEPYQAQQAERKEYVVSSFNTPVGVVVDYDEFGKLKYNVVEPQIYPELLAEIKEGIKSNFQKDHNVLDSMDFLKENAEKAAKKLKLESPNEIMLKAVQYHLKRDLLGFRRLDPLMQDMNVSAIYVDGIQKPVIVEFNGPQKIQTNIIFTDPQDLNVLITKLARVTGNAIDDNHPVLDIIYEGFRIQAVKGAGNTASRLIIKKVAL